jgi:hypothetical protein
MKNKIIKVLVTIILFVFGVFGSIFVIKLIKGWYWHGSLKSAVDNLKSEAAEKYPNIPLSNAWRETAREKSEKTMSSLSTRDERLKFAAARFFGFYYVYVEGFPKYCAARGVDIASFTQAFKDAHANEYRIASEVLSSPEEKQAKVILQQSDALLTIVEQTVKDSLEKYRITEKENCEIMKLNPQASSGGVSLRLVQPQTYEVLNGK